MGIKTILTLFAVGGVAGAAFYFRDGITESFASGKDKVTGLKDTLQEGSRGSNNSQLPLENNNIDTNKPLNKSQTETLVYVPIYHNNGQQSIQKNDDGTLKRPERKPNPTIQKYNSDSRKKTQRTISKFTSPEDKENVERYEKRKYGIDNKLLTKAVTKSPSRRNIEERKQIEAEKARNVFDSRKISNW